MYIVVKTYILVEFLFDATILTRISSIFIEEPILELHTLSELSPREITSMENALSFVSFSDLLLFRSDREPFSLSFTYYCSRKILYSSWKVPLILWNLQLFSLELIFIWIFYSTCLRLFSERCYRKNSIAIHKLIFSDWIIFDFILVCVFSVRKKRWY